MAGVTNLDQAARGCFSAHQSRVIRTHSLVGKQMIRALNQFTYPHADPDQTAKDGVEAAHQQRGSDALAGNIANQEIKIASVAADQIAVVATDAARRLIVIRTHPTLQLTILLSPHHTLTQ